MCFVVNATLPPSQLLLQPHQSATVSLAGNCLCDGVLDPATERGVIRFDDLDPGSIRARVIVPTLENGVENPFKVTIPDRTLFTVTVGSGQARESGTVLCDVLLQLRP